jgi:cellulose synthase/poly-beta-1,6-N-acetylglucosamine synthase-like glycosyltransferase
MMATNTLEELVYILKIGYAFCALVLFLYGLSTLSLSLIYLFNRKKIQNVRTPEPPAEWPRVTVQLPIYNERNVVERLLSAVTRFNYPANRLQIQVLDDSTDGFTSELLQKLIGKYQQTGINIQYLHRKDRRGYKAGNLASGMTHASGEFIAIFDADFIPGADWLKQVVPVFQDASVGFVQTRWVHMNFNSSFLAKMVSLAMDGHFVVEQGARSFAGLMMGFNGSAGMWRRATIEQAGGWQWDTLAEDLDLSYRAQMLGFRAVYLPHVTALCEAPETMNAFMIQQFRWAKGSVQVLRKLAGRLWWRTRLPLGKRIMGLVHMSMYLPFPFMLMLLLLAFPLGIFASSFFVYFPWTGLVTIGPPLMYALAKTENMPRLRDRLLLIPPLVLMGVGITVNCTVGVISGLLFKGGTFQVTPKSSTQNSREIVKKTSLAPTLGTTGELAMCVYLLSATYAISPTMGFTMAPWFLSSAAGFLFVFALSITRRRQNKPQAESDFKKIRNFIEKLF